MIIAAYNASLVVSTSVPSLTCSELVYTSQYFCIFPCLLKDLPTPRMHGGLQTHAFYCTVCSEQLCGVIHTPGALLPPGLSYGIKSEHVS